MKQNIILCLLAILFPLLISSCRVTPKHNLLREETTVRVGPFNLHATNVVSTTNLNEVIESLETHYATWATDFGREATYRIDVYVYWVRDLEKVLGMPATPQDLLGYTTRGPLGRTKEIYLIAGNYNQIPAAYHEFCHAFGASQPHGFDARHLDPLWPQWDARQEHINLILRKNR